MTKDVVHTIGQDASVEEAARRMRNVGRGCLVVIEEGRVVGILTATDFAKRLLTRAGSDPMLAAMARAAQLLSQSSEV
ncbi:MAG: CBS domain-containing protein [Thaumarchaeota archaeon]|nr:CBS domain-containing protein [Nitrososphaerota archaeon]